MDTLQNIKTRIINLDYSNIDSINGIRELVRNLPEANLKPTDDIERAILIANSAYKEKKSSKILNKLKSEDGISKYLSIFVGDSHIIDWPYFNPQLISDSQAEELLIKLSKFAIPHDELRNFVQSFFLTRKRELWTIAAEAIAHLALKDPTTKKYLVDLWNKCFPNGIDDKWFKTAGEVANKNQQSSPNIIHHEARHIFLSVSYYYVIASDISDFAGYDLERFKLFNLPEDPSDCSIVLSSLGILRTIKEKKKFISEFLVKKLPKLPKNILIENTLRRLYIDLVSDSEDPAAKSMSDAINAYLLSVNSVTFKDYTSIDLIYSWVLTLKLLNSIQQPIENYIQELPKDLKEIAFIVQEKNSHYDRNSYLSLLTQKLSILLNENVWFTNEIKTNVLNLICVMLLSEKNELANLPVCNVLGLAGFDDFDIEYFQLSGYLSQISFPFLFLIIKKRGVKTTPKAFFYGRNYSNDIIVGLSQIDADNKDFATQVAVQIETNLRSQKLRLEQVKVLWNLLSSDPHSKVLLELFKIIKGNETILHKIIKTIYDLDVMRDSKSNTLSTFIDEYYNISCLIGKLLMEDVESKWAAKNNIIKVENEIIINTLKELSEKFRALDFSILNDTEKVNFIINYLKDFLGCGQKSLLFKWFDFLGVKVENLENSWKEFYRTYKEFSETKRNLNEKQIHKLKQTYLVLEAEICKTIWPEHEIFSYLLQSINLWIDKVLLMHERSEQINEKLYNLVENLKDLEKVSNFVSAILSDKDKNELELVSPENIKRTHLFLLKNLEIRLAEKLRKNKIISDHVKLNPFLEHIGPLLVGVLAGPFIVLDIGSIWIEVLEAGRGLYYGLTIIMALTFSAIIYYTNFFRSAVYSSRTLIKGSLIFIISFGIAFFTSAVVLFTLSETSLTANLLGIPYLKIIILWSSLSLLLGWFIGIILQGRKILND